MRIRILPLLFLASHAWGEDSGEPGKGEKLFALRVKPLFAEKCLACHGDDEAEIEGGFDMRSREAMLRGGEHFGSEVLIPGNGMESYLHTVTTRTEEDYEMPPKEADRLSETQQEWILDWINEGAPWVEGARLERIRDKYAEGERVITSDALSGEWQQRRYSAEKLWAYRPLEVTRVPEGQHPVDFFVNRKLDQAAIDPAPSAAALPLLRRISFGLTGLPPDPDRIASFQSAYASDPGKAIEQLAGELMASPHYGEHFGRQWLDVTRYADSAGFANDYARPNAWRYRDYVVRSFNRDKSYKDFVTEQLAGDELDAGDPEHLIATGFLRMGPWEQTVMSVFRETRQQWLDDVTDATGQVFLAHALQCARCHDHKFDPIPTRDYYRMMAVFSTTQFVEQNAPFLKEESREGFEESDRWVEEKMAAYRKQQEEFQSKVAALKVEEEGEIQVGDNGLDPGDEASLGRINKNLSRHRWELDRTKPIALSVYTGNTIPVVRVDQRVRHPKGGPWANGELEEAAILAGGDPFSPTVPVSPGGLSAAESLGEMDPLPFPDGKGKRRTALARWITDERNPLTSRVIVNRVWAWHFGKGIAGNPNNFGGGGALPTHPGLLDYLADWFMANDWSVKALNTLILSSETYRRDSRHRHAAELAIEDPKGDLYATFPPRRLTAEEIRDAMLCASGELNRRVGGIPSRPDVDPEVAFQPRQIMGGTASVYEPNPLPAERNRRSLYSEKIRGMPDPFGETFNQPGSDMSCELREASTVATQALTLFNSEEVLERATAFAQRLINETKQPDEVIDRAYQLALGRLPSPIESEACLAHWQEASIEEAEKTYPARSFPIELERTVAAEKTGQAYTFTEHMPAFKRYQPDLHPGVVDAQTRGLAQVCLVLFNLNEFSYLD